MKRSKSLLFKSFELFRSWYTNVKTRFNTLRLVFMHRFASKKEVRVVVTY